MADANVTQSTTAQGDNFRDQITDLLRLSGWQPVREKLVAGKKADAFWSRTTYGRPVHMALESKNYASPLGRDDLVRIVTDYQDAYEHNIIDELWIVASKDITGAGAREFVDSKRWLRFFTFESLRASLMDFGTYLGSLMEDYQSSGLPSYYVPQTAQLQEDSITENVDIENAVSTWLTATDDPRPLAIVGGYGLGKTSFARRITYGYANEYRAQLRGRIPIYIELGRFSTQQDLSGLLGSALAADRPVDGYRYQLFLQLNRAGHFLIILDAFDEMKHLMTLDDFNYNFDQLNQLIEGNAKVILLGRPSAFGSEGETEWLLHGRRPVDGQQLRDHNRPDYRVYRLEHFDKDRIDQFIASYLRFREAALARRENRAIDKEFIGRRMREIKEIGYGELLERPVQAKMLVDIAADKDFKLKRFTRYGLYENFIDRLIEREVQKPQRRAFSAKKRRRFLQELAWWMWKENKTVGVRLSEIPDALFSKIPGNSESPEGKRRDLLMGSLLEEKTRDRFVIPHRSFLEFLIAEYLVEIAADGTLDGQFLQQNCIAITPDVLTFIEEARKPAFFSHIDELLGKLRGNLAYEFLIAFGNSGVGFRNLKRRSPEQMSHLQLFARLLPLCEDTEKSGKKSGWSEAEPIIRKIVTSREHPSEIIAAALLVALKFAWRTEGTTAPLLIANSLISALPVDRLRFEEGPRRAKNALVNIGDGSGRLLKAFIEAMSNDRPSLADGDTALSIFLSFRPLAAGLLDVFDASVARTINASSADLAIGYFIGGDGMLQVPLNKLYSEKLKGQFACLRSYLIYRPKVIYTAQSGRRR